MASNKEMRKIAKDAAKCGFMVDQTKGGHYKIKGDSGILVIPFSPGSARSEKTNKLAYEKFKKEHV